MEIIFYTMDHCSMCDQAKEYLDDLGLEYETKNVSTNKDYRNRLLQRGHMGVPIIEIDGEDVVGFNVEKLDELLKKTGEDSRDIDE